MHNSSKHITSNPHHQESHVLEIGAISAVNRSFSADFYCMGTEMTLRFINSKKHFTVVQYYTSGIECEPSIWPWFRAHDPNYIIFLKIFLEALISQSSMVSKSCFLDCGIKQTFLYRTMWLSARNNKIWESSGRDKWIYSSISCVLSLS